MLTVVVSRLISAGPLYFPLVFDKKHHYRLVCAVAVRSVRYPILTGPSLESQGKTICAAAGPKVATPSETRSPLLTIFFFFSYSNAKSTVGKSFLRCGVAPIWTIEPPTKTNRTTDGSGVYHGRWWKEGSPPMRKDNPLVRERPFPFEFEDNRSKRKGALLFM